MLIEVVVNKTLAPSSPIASTPSAGDSFSLSIYADSYLELVNAVYDAVGDIIVESMQMAMPTRVIRPAPKGIELFAKHSYYVLNNYPFPSSSLSQRNRPLLIIACEDTFAFLEEEGGYVDAVLVSFLSSNEGTTLQSISVPPPRLELVVSLEEEEKRPSTASSSSVGFVVHQQQQERSKQAPRVPTPPPAVARCLHSDEAEAQQTATPPQGGMQSAVDASNPISPEIDFVCLSEKINGKKIPFANSFREMWRNISHACPRITKGVFRLTARRHSNEDHSEASPLIVDVDNEDDYNAIKGLLLKGTMLIEGIDLCRVPLARGAADGSETVALRRKDALLRELGLVPFSAEDTKRSGAGVRDVSPQHQLELHDRLSDQKKAHQQQLVESERRLFGAVDLRHGAGRGVPSATGGFKRAASLD